jgi:hypothetical protein
MENNQKWNAVLEIVASETKNENYDSAAKAVYDFVFNSDYAGAYSPKMIGEVYEVVRENVVDESSEDKFQERWEYHNEMGA